MAISLAQFVRQDENIVKMPKVALVNNADTLPPKTRPLNTALFLPFLPSPNNLGEIGSYIFVAGDPTPIGDERFDSDSPTPYAVEYMVYVTDEGSGINVSSEQGFENIDGWSPANADTFNLGLSNRDPTQGSFALTFSKLSGTSTFGGAEKNIRSDFTKYVGLNLFYDIYFPNLVGVEGARLRLEDASGNVRVWEETSLSVGWQTITADFDNPNITNDVGFDVTDIEKVRFAVRFSSTTTVFLGVEVDDFKGTEILSGKLEAGDVEVGFARNSAWQTRFEFQSALNRWAFLVEDLGEITNDPPRLRVPETFINDFDLRPIDFIIEVAGTALTVVAVANEIAFGTPVAGTVEFARTEATFNFSSDDLNTFKGKIVTYREVGDGTATAVWNGTTAVATLERGLTMEFSPNPLLSKKDLALNHSLSDEIVTSSLGATKFIPLTFVPNTGTTSLRYDPVPTGAPDPLVDGVDFVIDEAAPAIRFTRSSVSEILLADYTVNPQNPGDPDSSVKRFESLGLDNTDLIPNTVAVTQTTPSIGLLTEDTDYLVDLEPGTLFLTEGLREEELLNNIFIPDPTFLSANFDFYINGVPLEEFILIADVGWVNIDDPLFPGDVVTVDYVSEDEGSFGEDNVPVQITGQTVHTPGVELLNGRLITASEPAAGGEFSFTVQNPPVQVTRFEIAFEALDIVLPTDRTGDYTAGALMLIQEDYYQIDSVAYNVGDNATTITLAVPARRPYSGPTVFYSKRAPVLWVSDATPHGPIPEGVSSFVLAGGGDLDLDLVYTNGTYLRFFGNDIYRVQGSAKVNDGVDLEVQLTTKFTQSVDTSATFEHTVTAIPKVGDDTFQSFYNPILDIPPRFDPNGDLISLEVRFPGLSTQGVKVIRNGVDLVKDFDYEITNDGALTLLREPLDAADDTLVLRYLPLVQTNIEDEIESDYVYFADSESGIGLRITTEYDLPDTFYFRVVNNNTQAIIFQEVIDTFIKQKTGQVSSGSSPAIPTPSGNHGSGVITPISDVGDRYDLDLIAQRIYDFYTERIGFLETEKMELIGEIPGGASGPLTEAQLTDTNLFTNRLFPLDDEVLKAIKKDKDTEEMIPVRPRRLPGLFGMSVEDDKTQITPDLLYPTFPKRGIIPFPPTGKTYRGMNQEPGLFGGTGGFYQTGQAAGAPSTFIEHWYPGFLDMAYVNPLTSAMLIDYTISAADYDGTAVGVNQDTGDPADTTPVFPPADLELDPEDYESWSNSSFPNPVFESVAPRDTTFVPNSYEGAALGALQKIDDEIEGGFLAGTPHRSIVGDDTSYPLDPPPDALGFVYRDLNEYDLLTNGTVVGGTEIALIDAEWQGARPVDVSTYTDNIKQQILALNIQVASLQRQIDVLNSLIVQLVPAPTANPEGTTVTQATTARDAAVAWQTRAQAALDGAQAWYDDVVIASGGAATDQQIIDRWFFLTGVDATGAPTSSPLPTAPITGYGRVQQVIDRIDEMVDRVKEIHSTLGFDGTNKPTGFEADATSENLYETRYIFLDLRVNRKSGTMFFALNAHDEYTKDINEAASLLVIAGIFGG